MRWYLYASCMHSLREIADRDENIVSLVKPNLDRVFSSTRTDYRDEGGHFHY